MNRSLLSVIFLFFSHSALAFPFFHGDQRAEEQKKAENQLVEIEENKILDKNFTQIAILQVLNKITAKISNLEAPINEEIAFGRLKIITQKCWKAPPDQRPKNKILIKVLELDSKEEDKTIFHGWIFSSSPSISGLEHPIYDITAIECRNKQEDY
jgi:hypothetical protein